jgi:hypothetical protein
LDQAHLRRLQSEENPHVVFRWIFDDAWRIAFGTEWRMATHSLSVYALRDEAADVRAGLKAYFADTLEDDESLRIWLDVHNSRMDLHLRRVIGLPNDPHRNLYGVPQNETVLTGLTYLVRTHKDRMGVTE